MTPIGTLYRTGRGSNSDELGVAEQAIRLAQLSRNHDNRPRETPRRLLSDGQGGEVLERQLGYRVPVRNDSAADWPLSPLRSI